MFHSYIMSPNQWGPPTWTLFHTIAEKMNEEAFPVLMPQFIFFLKRICSVLPCPECSQHATQFWKNINVAGIKTTGRRGPKPDYSGGIDYIPSNFIL